MRTLRLYLKKKWEVLSTLLFCRGGGCERQNENVIIMGNLTKDEESDQVVFSRVQSD